MGLRPPALTDPTQLWGTISASARRSSVLRGRARRSVFPLPNISAVWIPASDYMLSSNLKCPGHCRAVGCLRGRILSSVSQWKSRHLPFPHQEMCRQVKNIFYMTKCASHWKSTNLNKTEIAQKPFKVFFGVQRAIQRGEAIPANLPRLTSAKKQKNNIFNNHLHKSLLKGYWKEL